ncbi:neuropeptide FF receptor 1-like [Oculina patagonica]
MCLVNCTENSTGFNSTASQSCKLFAENSQSVKFIKTFAYATIMLFSLLGNTAVIFIVSKNKRMWTTTNYLIANMAASDLLISAFAVPRELTEIFTGPRRWLIDGLAGLILCKLVYIFQDISTAVSIQSLVVIAIDRYRGVVFPFRPPIITSKVCKVVIPVIWIVALGVHGTYFYTVRLVMQDNKTYCTFSWAPKFAERQSQERYFIFISVFLILLPLCVIFTLYLRIALELKRRPRTDSRARRQRQREDTAIMKRIICIVFLFVLCITPITIAALLLYFVWDWNIPCGMDHLFTVSKFVFYSNASLNPCVYFTLNDKYRKALKDLLTFKLSLHENKNRVPMNSLQQN